jgi:hypothetical protein
MEAEYFVQPPNAVPIPGLADTDGQGYVVAGGISRFVSIPAVLTPAAYVAGGTIGGLMNITGAARAVGLGSGMLYGVTIVDPGRNTPPSGVDLIYFNSNPAASTFTDNVLAVLAAADAAKVIGVEHVTDWTIYGAAGCSVGNGLNAGLIYSLGKTGANVNTTLFAAAVVRGSFNGVAGLTFNFKLMPD